MRAAVFCCGGRTVLFCSRGLGLRLTRISRGPLKTTAVISPSGSYFSATCSPRLRSAPEACSVTLSAYASK